MQIGDTLYHFDINRRIYTKPERGSGRVWGEIIYAEHFRPLKIVGETRQSWVLEYNHKVKKADPRKGGYYTAAQMADNLWVHDHKHKLRDLLDRATAEQLREIAKVLGYKAE